MQINFFSDHTKLILCPLMGAVTYISEKRDFTTYKFNLIAQHGCSPILAQRLKYAADVVERLVSTKLTKK